MDKRISKGHGHLTCEGSEKGINLTIQELFQQQAVCGECCSRFPLKDPKRMGAASVMLLPKHTIPPELHEYRRKTERESKDAKNRQEQRI